MSAWLRASILHDDATVSRETLWRLKKRADGTAFLIEVVQQKNDPLPE